MKNKIKSKMKRLQLENNNKINVLELFCYKSTYFTQIT